MAGEAHLVAHLGGLRVDPGIGGVGQHLALQEGLDATLLQQGDLLAVTQVGVGFVLHHAGLAADLQRKQAAQGIGRHPAALVHLGNHRRSALLPPAHLLEQQLQVYGAEFEALQFEGILHLAAEMVVVVEQLIAEQLLQRFGRRRQLGIALPGGRIQQLLASLLGDAALAAGLAVALVVSAIVDVLSGVIAGAPLPQPLLQFWLQAGEIVQQRIAVVVPERCADLPVARGGAQRLDRRRCDAAVQAQRPLYAHLPIAKGLIGKHLGVFALLHRVIGRHHPLNVGRAHDAVLFTLVFAQWLEPAAGIDQLHLALPFGRLAVAQQPHIGGNPRVVEEIQGQGHDRLHPVVLEQPAADVAFARSRIAGEQRGAVVHLGDAAAQGRVVIHLAGHVGQKQHLAITGARHQR